MKNNITHRELEVLDLLSQGLSSREIALSLFLSAETIKTHRKNLIAKLCAKNVAHLIRIAFEEKVIDNSGITKGNLYNIKYKHQLVA